MRPDGVGGAAAARRVAGRRRQATMTRPDGVGGAAAARCAAGRATAMRPGGVGGAAGSGRGAATFLDSSSSIPSLAGRRPSLPSPTVA
jgi:hypothetical protein